MRYKLSLTKQETQREEEQRGQHLHDPGRERRRQDQLRRDWREFLNFQDSEHALYPSVWEDFMWWMIDSPMTEEEEDMVFERRKSSYA